MDPIIRRRLVPSTISLYSLSGHRCHRRLVLILHKAFELQLELLDHVFGAEDFLDLPVASRLAIIHALRFGFIHT